MASRNLGTVLGHFDQLFGPGTLAGLSERQLLERFITVRDPEAFEAIVRRHGPMVLGVCRRWLADPHDADDAFQATFLILVRKAESLRNRDVLASWLYGIANRVARRARQQAVSRHRREAAAALRHEEVVSSMTPTQFGPELHQEIDRLPGNYRNAIVLCYLEGRTHEEAARELGWPIGTVKGRLARARDLLRQRLLRRGVAAPAALLVAALESDAAVVAPALTADTVRAGLLMATGHAMAAGMVPAVVSELVDEVVNAMTLTKWKTLAIVGSIAACSVVGGAVALGRLQGSGEVRKHTSGGPGGRGPGATQVRTAAQVTNLLQQRLEIAKRLFERTQEGVKSGTQSLASLLEPARLLMEAERDANSDPGARAAAVRAYIERLEQNYEYARNLAETGAAPARAVDEAELALVEAKIALEKEQGPQVGAVGVGPGMMGAGTRGGEGNTSVGGPAMMASSGGGAGMQMMVPGMGSGMGGPMGGGLGGMSGVGGAIGMGGFGGGGADVDNETGNRVRAARPRFFRSVDDNARTQAIVAKLNEIHEFPFENETPLEDVVKYVREATRDGQFPNGIPIYIDPLGMQEAEKTMQSTVKIALEGVPLRTSLRLALKQLDLVYVVKEGLLMISYPSSENFLDEIERDPDGEPTEPTS
jgi:RNA polymerase sigma factor (sigma-70 family)